jgi:hypothetical protein
MASSSTYTGKNTIVNYRFILTDCSKNMQHTHMSVLLNTDVLTLSAAREYTIPEALLR